MSALAKLALIRGNTVSGSDAVYSDELTALNEAGVRAYAGHSPEIAMSADLVVYSGAIKENDPELRSAYKGLSMYKSFRTWQAAMVIKITNQNFKEHCRGAPVCAPSCPRQLPPRRRGRAKGSLHRSPSCSPTRENWERKGKRKPPPLPLLFPHRGKSGAEGYRN